MRFVLLATGWLLLDQWSKWMIMTRMAEGQSIPLVDSILYLTYVRNPGAAFGMLPNKTAFFIFVTFAVMLGIIWFFRRIPESRVWLKVGLALQMGGAVGNLIDRIRFGHVVDFFDFRVWPVFNVADIGIVIGVGILFIELMRRDPTPGDADNSGEKSKTSER